MDTRTFRKHATTDSTGAPCLSREGFIDAIAPNVQGKIAPSQYGVLFDVADRRGAGALSLPDWLAFAELLSKPDAEYEIAFRVFDRDNDGRVGADHVAALQQNLPVSPVSGSGSGYAGKRGGGEALDYPQFAQLVKDSQAEHVRNAFRALDNRRDAEGCVSARDLQDVVAPAVRQHVSDHVLEHLPLLADSSATSGGEKISLPRLRAFQNVVAQLDLIEHIVHAAVARSPDGKVDREGFMDAAVRATRSALFTPLEVDVLFHFAVLGSSSSSSGSSSSNGKHDKAEANPRLTLPDFLRVVDPMYTTHAPPAHAATSGLQKSKDLVKEEVKSFVYTALESLHHFGLGSLAGAFGAFMVYPIDLVKTRMQNQRSVRVGSPLYANSIDCAKKVIRHEGLRGLYSGVMPQLVGVAPEKAIKLTVNDISRELLTNKSTGQLWTPLEPVAGGSAGACQVIFTNPLEIVKIRLQMQGEAVKSDPSVPRRSAIWIVRHLGLKGLYKGASACLLRDIPFSGIYFPTYAHIKKDIFHESPAQPLNIIQLLTAGAIAGMPAAYFTTPCDVIKTRLQSEARQGETRYTSLRHCARSIARDEGFKAFFKGGPARVLRSSPQFGFTLAAYEMLQKVLPMPGSADTHHGIAPGEEVQPSSTPLPFLRSRNAMRLLLDLDQNFGLLKLPKTSSTTTTAQAHMQTQSSSSERQR